MEKRLEEYIHNLSKLIDLPTVSDVKEPNEEVFARFRELLKEIFPNVFGTFTYEEFHGSILLSRTVEGGREPVMFMSHYDVVSANGRWEHKPFKACVDGDKLYGRGTLDTKGNLWAILTAFEELIKEGAEFSRPVYIVSDCREETTGEGADEISRELEKRGVRFAFTLDEGGMITYDPIGGADGTFAMVALGEKDCLDVKFTAKSNGGHSSTPDKNSPINRLARFVCDVEGQDKLFKPKVDDTLMETFRKLSPKMSGVLKFIFGHAGWYKHILAKILTKFSPTANSMVRTTICFTKAKGSDEFNVIPTEAYVTGNIRVAHHDTSEEVIKKLEKIAGKHGIEVTVLDPGYPSRVCDYNTEEFKFLERMVSESFEGVITAPYVSNGASDSKYFDKLSDNVFRFAPFTVTDAQLDTIHAREENMDISTLVPAVDFYKNLIRKM